MTHHAALGCDQARLALSARLDGEAPGVTADRLDAHLRTCAGCRDWLTHAEQLTRLVRMQPARVPDLTEAILVAVAADQAARTATPTSSAATPARKAARLAGSLQNALRAAVAGIASIQLVLAISDLLGGGFDTHTSHEMGSLDVAVAVGFLLAAFQPRLARAYTPIAVVLAICLAATSGWDVAHHHVTLAHELTSHLATIAQAGLLSALARLTSRHGAPPMARPDTARA
jgi:predicted anti-sigma-YlaC factor YlaD